MTASLSELQPRVGPTVEPYEPPKAEAIGSGPVVVCSMLLPVSGVGAG